MQWLFDHWSQLITASTALSGMTAVLWRLRLGRFVRDRITVELDLIECNRRTAHREVLLSDLLAEIDWYKRSRTGSGSGGPHTTPPATTSPRPLSPPNETSPN